MKLPPEEQFIIVEKIILINKDLDFVSDHRSERYEYSRETRYPIVNCSMRVITTPARLIKLALADECSAASGHMPVVRQYKSKVDSTYFKYIDDAEEVLELIKEFTIWLKKNLEKIQKKKKGQILTRNELFLTEKVATQEWIIASKIILEGKRRGELSPLMLDTANERDLLDHKRH